MRVGKEQLKGHLLLTGDFNHTMLRHSLNPLFCAILKRRNNPPCMSNQKEMSYMFAFLSLSSKSRMTC